MFLIKRVGDARLARRISESYGIDGAWAVYAACKDDTVLATAVFVEEGDCIALAGVDTGRRMDVDLVDGLARAAFSAAQRTGMKRALLGEGLSKELRLALTKLGYAQEAPFALDAFFADRRCAKP